MHLNSLLVSLIFLIFFSNCTSFLRKDTACSEKTITMYSKIQKKDYKIILCVDSSLHEVIPIEWGIRLSKKFENSCTRLEIKFLNGDEQIPDPVLVVKGYDICSNSLKNGKLEKQYKISSNGLSGIVTEFSDSETKFNLFMGFEGDAKIPIEIVHNTKISCSSSFNFELFIKSIECAPLR